MAWNQQSYGEKVKATRSRRKSTHPSLRWISVFLGVVIAAVLTVWLLRPADNSNEHKDTQKKSTRIREVKPRRPAQKKILPKAEEAEGNSDRSRKELPPQQLGEGRDGYVLLGSGLHKIRGEVTNNCALTKGKYEIFKHSAENTIAALLSIKAGDTLIGEPDYQGSFAESLRRSLKEDIKIEETDTPEQAELKQAVIEVKEELKKAMDRGEDVEQIILESRRECQELARAKQMMMADVYDFVDKDAITKDDVETYVEAANKLLESKGIAPIERSTLVDIKLRHKLDDYDHDEDEEEE